MKSCEEFQSSLLNIHNGCLWGDRGIGKSYGLARIALARNIGQPIVITAAGFRQSRIVKYYIEQLCAAKGIDINTLNISCVPVSQLKSFIKGLHCLLLVDEFTFIPREYLSVITSTKNWVAVASND